ncbi:MAG TPA: hypothetical protein ENJ00_07890 [Phycisphaerales bacterium]|nr:hypothetical protein [Phycisphaerales bacterium]
MTTLIGVLLALVAQNQGCASLPTPSRPISGDLPIRVGADWDDLEAAVRRAARTTELAILHKESTGTGEADSTARYELISIAEQRMWISFRALESWTPDSGPIEIEIDAGTEPFLEDTQRRILIAEVAKHLKALAGRDWAP